MCWVSVGLADWTLVMQWLAACGSVGSHCRLVELCWWSSWLSRAYSVTRQHSNRQDLTVTTAQ